MHQANRPSKQAALFLAKLLTNVDDEKHEDTQKLGSPKQAKAAPLSTFPINHLPPEILAEVFWNCLPETMPQYAISSRKAPLLLCRVCSLWRKLALVTPTLWTTLAIVIRKLSMDLLVGGQVINTWLERSGTLPLELSLLYSPPWRPQGTTVPTLLETILTVFYPGGRS